MNAVVQVSEDELAAEGAIPLPAAVKPSERPIIVYEQAVTAIQACSTLLEAKHWNNKADALAAWAKVYADDRVMTEARALKLHAYRQIGRLADSMRIQRPTGPGGYRNIGGSTHGAHSLLQEHGFNKTNAGHALKIGRLDDRKFNEVVRRKKPPSPTQLCVFELKPNPYWSELANRLSIFLSATKKVAPENLAESLTEKQQVKALDMITRAKLWLDQFEAAILKFRSVKSGQKEGPAGEASHDANR